MSSRAPKGRADVPTRIRNAYGEFVAIPSSLIRAHELSDGAVRLYGLLWDYSNERDRDAWPKRSTMADDLGISVDTIDRRVKELEKFGAIAVEAYFDAGRQVSNIYTILRLEQPEVIHRGRKSAAPKSRKDAAPGGRKSAAPIEPEPKEPEISGPVPLVTTDAQELTKGTGPAITPATISATYGRELHHADVFAAVGRDLPGTFDDAALDQLAGEIIARSAARVFDPTGYVIRTLRNPDGRLEWLTRAFDIDIERHLKATGTAGF